MQLHGGIGFTWEHDCHLFLKRAKLEPGAARRASAATSTAPPRLLVAA